MKFTKSYKNKVIARSDEIGVAKTFDELNRKKKKGTKVPSYATIGLWRTERRKEIGEEKDKQISFLEKEFFDAVNKIDVKELRETKKSLEEIKKSLSEIEDFRYKLRTFSLGLRRTLEDETTTVTS